jgi:hypothetical protein
MVAESSGVNSGIVKKAKCQSIEEISALKKISKRPASKIDNRLASSYLLYENGVNESRRKKSEEAHRHGEEVS